MFITTDLNAMPIASIHRAIASTYWATNIPLDTFTRALQHSLNFAALDADTFIGFARVISDRATFAYLCDVWVEPSWRGAGIGKRLMTTITAHPDLQGLRRQLLMTRDAHGLYAQFGFRALAKPELAMEKHNPSIYQGNQVC